jgi:hypothetical protein
MAQIAIRAGMEVVREVTHVTIHANPLLWHQVGTPLLHDAKMLIFNNFTDADLMISDINLNGYGKIPIAASSYIILDISSNKNDIGKSLTVAKGTRYFVQAIAPEDPSVGSFYISVIYGEV